MLRDTADPSAKPNLIFIWGNSRHGKSTLCQELNHADKYLVLSTDEIYVSFISNCFPELYFPLLHAFVQPHYQAIFRVPLPYPGTKKQYTSHLVNLNNIDDLWWDHLLISILKTLEAGKDAIVEGWHLGLQEKQLSRKIKEQLNVTPIKVHASNHQYFLNYAKEPLTKEELTEALKKG